MRQVKMLLLAAVNLVRFLIEVATSRLHSTPVRLHWGSHREEYGLSAFIIDVEIEESPDIVLSVNDPVVKKFRHRHAFEDRAIYRLRDATFDPNTGYVYLDNKLVRESHSLYPHVTYRKLNTSRHIAKRPVIGVTSQLHYHWLIETLPRVIAASQYEPDALLIAPEHTPTVQRDALEMLGLEIQYSDARHQCDELILATRGLDSGWAHPNDIDLLRERFGVPSMRGTERIFVSRTNSRRSDETSKQIDRFAISQGWTVVRAEQMTWRDHLSTFGKALLVAGEHGAGLANIALAPLESRLIELVRKDCANPCYAALSLVINDKLDFYELADLLDFGAALASDMS